MFTLYDIINIFNFSDFDKLQLVRDRFVDDVNEFYNKIQINNTTRKNAIIDYLSRQEIKKDTTNPKTYTDGCSILIINNVQKYTEREISASVDIAKPFLDIIKTAEHLKDEEPIMSDIATARALGWKPSVFSARNDFYIKIGCAYYDFNKFYKLYNCIADSGEKYNEGATLKQEPNNRRAPIIMQSKYGCAVLLPVINALEPHYSKIINFKNAHAKIDEIEKSLREKIRATA